MSAEQTFHQAVKKSLKNSELQNRTINAAGKHQFAMAEAVKQFSDRELARNRAKYIKWRVNENLDKYLIGFEANLMRKVGKVITADTAQTAWVEMEQINKKNQAMCIVK